MKIKFNFFVTKIMGRLDWLQEKALASVSALTKLA